MPWVLFYSVTVRDMTCRIYLTGICRCRFFLVICRTVDKRNLIVSCAKVFFYKKPDCNCIKDFCGSDFIWNKSETKFWYSVNLINKWEIEHGLCACTRFSEGIIDRTGAQTMLYLTRSTITSVDLAHYRVSRAKDWVSVNCGTRRLLKSLAWAEMFYVCLNM